MTDAGTSTGMRVYEPDGDVLEAYLWDRSEVSIIRGPIGSGTSSCSCMKIWLLASEQGVFQGKRKSRFFIIRNTYGELRNTTMKTWLQWFPEDIYGTVFWSRPMRHEVRVGDIELDVYFLALDGEDDIKLMRSLEITGAWMNELEFQLKAIFDEIRSRCRYPAVNEGGSKWLGVLGDMNAPTSDNWLVQMTGEAPLPDEMTDETKASMVWPGEWAYFVQPPAVVDIMAADGKTLVGYRTNPGAENLKWLPPRYYDKMIAGNSRQWIKSRLQNKITYYVDGEVVWPMFNEELHVAPGDLVPVAGHDVFVSLDFGRRPTALCAQRINERLFCQFEFRMYGVSSATFAPALKKFLSDRYPGGKWRFRFTGDPKGQDKGQADERTSYDIFKSCGMVIIPAPVKNNHLATRLTAVESVFNRLVNGKSAILVSRACKTLVSALMGGYHVKKNSDGDPEPVKDKASDIADTLQYMCLFMGEGRTMIGQDAESRTGRVNVRGGGKSQRRVA